MTLSMVGPCNRRCGTFKIPHYSMTMSVENRSNKQTNKQNKRVKKFNADIMFKYIYIYIMFRHTVGLFTCLHKNKIRFKILLKELKSGKL